MIDLDPEMTLRPEVAFRILLQARAFGLHALAEGAPDSAPLAAGRPGAPDDGGAAAVLGAVAGLEEEARLDLLALLWIGRGDYGWSGWRQAREAARLVGRAEAPGYVLHMPRGSDHLQASLQQLGFLPEEFLDGGLDGPPAR